jgi:hypothetical protein
VQQGAVWRGMHAAFHASGFGHRPGASPAGSRLTDGRSLNSVRRKARPKLESAAGGAPEGVRASLARGCAARRGTCYGCACRRSAPLIVGGKQRMQARPRLSKNGAGGALSVVGRPALSPPALRRFGRSSKGLGFGDPIAYIVAFWAAPAGCRQGVRVLAWFSGARLRAVLTGCC